MAAARRPSWHRPGGREEPPAGGLQQVDDGRRPRQGRIGGVGRPESRTRPTWGRAASIVGGEPRRRLSVPVLGTRPQRVEGAPSQTTSARNGSLCIRHTVDQPAQGSSQGLTSGLRARQALDQRQLPVAVPELGAADDQPAVAGRQTLQTIQVPPAGLIVEQLLMLGCGAVGRLNRCIRHDRAPTARDPPQLVADAVFHRVLEVRAQRSGVPGLEEWEPREGTLQRVLDEIAGVAVAAHPPRQAAPRPAQEPRPVPFEQGVYCRPTAPARVLEEKPLRGGVGGSTLGGGLPGCRSKFFRWHDAADHASERPCR